MSATVIIDTDPGIDDALAILMALASPEIEVEALTTVFGNTSVDFATINALRLVELAGVELPVYRGAGVPLVRTLQGFPTQVHGRDGMGDTTLPKPTRLPESDSACEFLIRTVRERPGEITILALGPLTNIARALQEDPAIAVLVREVVIMGGAFFCAGNVTPVAEANIRSDPHAADLVFGAGWPLTAVGLDVTAHVLMDEPGLRRISRSGSILGSRVHEISRVYLEFERSLGVDGIKLHDPAAVAYLIDPTLFRTENGPVRVVPEGLAEGQTICARGWHAETLAEWRNRPDISVAVEVEDKKVLEMVEGKLSST